MCNIHYQHDNSLFSNIFGFLRLPLACNPCDVSVKSDWVITGVPFDMATSGRSGSRFGPNAIRQASINLVWERYRWPWKFNIHDKLRIIDSGDLIYKFGDIQNFTNMLENHVQNLLLSKTKLFAFGGDHYITLPILRVYKKFFGKMALIHFDAHADYYDNHNLYDHGAFTLYAINEELIDAKCSVQIGIRTEYNTHREFKVLDAEYVNDTSIELVISKIVNVVQDLPVYLTFDIDCLDPSSAPGTGTPVIGGLTPSCVLKLIRGLKQLNIVGMDIVELSPVYDSAQITALAAATLALEMLYIQAKT